MVGRSERLATRPVNASPPTVRLYHVPGLRALPIAAVALAALVAIVAVLVTSHAGAPAAAIAVRVALPGVATTAPATLAQLQDPPAGTSSGLLNTPLSTNTREVVTARRYAAHLTAEFVTVAQTVAVPLRTPEQVQAALAAAAAPQLIRAADPADDGAVISDSVLAARLGLAPGAPLPPFFPYEVQRGDTVGKIARRFGINPETILFNNWEIRDGDQLEVGATLTIPPRDGVVYTVRLGDTLFDVALNYAAEVEAVLAFPGNQLTSADQLVEGETILLPGGSASLPAGGAGGIAAGSVFAIPDFAWPLGGILCDFFGTPRGNRAGFHTGVDLCASTGTFIGSTAPGVVIQAGWDGSFGLSVLVDHGGGVVSRYAHMSQIDVFLGQSVDVGTLLGFVGSTGYSTGSHLHFEILMGGAAVDPLVWLNS